MSLWAVIPALNEAATLRDLVVAVRPLVDGVVVVDDGSTDGTGKTVDGLDVVLVSHPQRMGKGVALRDGFDEAMRRGAEAVITLDADGQHAPADIPRLAAAWRANPARIVIGARLIGRESQPAARRRANNVADWFVSWAAGQRVVDSQSGQRIYPKAAMELARHCRSNGFDFEADILVVSARHGIRWVAVPIEARYAPEFRQSHFAPVRDIARITRQLGGHIIRGAFLPGHLWRLRKQRMEVVNDGSLRGSTDPLADLDAGPHAPK